jgi:hypothetical protein
MESTILLRNINGAEKRIILDEDLQNGPIWQLKQRIDPSCHFSLVWNGQILCDSKSLNYYQLQNQSVIHLIYPLHGGGNDGGSIPTRGEMVKIKKNSKRNDSSAARSLHRWITCAISKQPLAQPIVADELGNILNKEEVIKGLIEKNLGSRYNHIRSLKDVFEVNFTFNAKYDPTQPGQLGVRADDESPFQCPVTAQPVNGQLPFSLLITCGHVISEKGLQQICDSPNPICFVCQKYFTKSDILPLNPDEETQVKLRTKRSIKEKEMNEKSQQSTLKRKFSTKEESKKTSKKPNTTQGTVRNTLAVQAALEKVNANHDAKKRLSEAYKSIFSAPSHSGSSTAFFTGTSRGVIK